MWENLFHKTIWNTAEHDLFPQSRLKVGNLLARSRSCFWDTLLACAATANMKQLNQGFFSDRDTRLCRFYHIQSAREVTYVFLILVAQRTYRKGGTVPLLEIHIQECTSAVIFLYSSVDCRVCNILEAAEELLLLLQPLPSHTMWLHFSKM